MSTNVFADLGFPNPDQELEKAHLVVGIRRMIDEGGLSREAAAEAIGIPAVELTDLFRGQWKRISSEALRTGLDRLKQKDDPEGANGAQ